VPTKLNPDATSSRKMLQLYVLLSFSGRKHTLTSLAERLQCSKATIIRLIADIELSESIETGKDGRERWYRLNKIKKNIVHNFAHEDIQGLVFCRDVIRGLLPDGILDQLTKSIDSAAKSINDVSVREYSLTQIAHSRMKGVIDYTPFQSIISIIMQAIPKKRLCAVNYLSANSQKVRDFIVAPMRMMAYHESLYIECWRIKEQDSQEVLQPMTLAVQRIKMLSPLRKKHKFTECPANNSNGFGFIDKKPIRLKVRFSASVVPYVSERQWSSDQEIVINSDGSAYLWFTTKNIEECFSWLLSFGELVEILEPMSCRIEFIQKITILLDTYKQK